MTYREAVEDICKAAGIVGPKLDELMATAPPDIREILDYQIPEGTEEKFKQLTTILILEEAASRN